MRGIHIDSLIELDDLLKPNENAVYLLDDENKPIAVVTSVKHYWETKAEVAILAYLFGTQESNEVIDNLFDQNLSREKLIAEYAKYLEENN